MLSNDNQRLNLWVQAQDRFSYQEHIAQCEQAGCEPLSGLEFAQKAGMLAAAQREFADIPAADAYLAFIGKHTQEPAPPQLVIAPEEPTIIKTCCGGGQVR